MIEKPNRAIGEYERPKFIIHNQRRMTPPLSRIVVGLLVLEIIGLLLLLNSILPFPKPLLLALHSIVAVTVTYAAARMALVASRPEHFDAVATTVFLIVLVVFNPFYPLLLTTVHSIVANVIAALLLLHYANRARSQFPGLAIE